MYWERRIKVLSNTTANVSAVYECCICMYTCPENARETECSLGKEPVELFLIHWGLFVQPLCRLAGF